MSKFTVHNLTPAIFEFQEIHNCRLLIRVCLYSRKWQTKRNEIYRKSAVLSENEMKPLNERARIYARADINHYATLDKSSTWIFL